MKRTICTLLTAVLLLGMFPAAYAAAPFTDVAAESWYIPYVDYCYENGLMNGVTETEFQPDAQMTRGMLVTVLYRIAGEPASNGVHPFTDVAPGSWYENAISWAYECQVVNGTSSTTFSPDEMITREALVTIFYRYAASQCYPVDKAYHGISEVKKVLTDAWSTSSWAQDAMAWAYFQEIINGVGENKLAPQGFATRAACAAIIKRYMDWTAPSESKDYSDPLAIYTPISRVNNHSDFCAYDVKMMCSEMVEYGESLGMTFVDLNNDANVPENYTVAIISHNAYLQTCENPKEYRDLLKYMIDEAYILMHTENAEHKYFFFQAEEYPADGAYKYCLKFLHPVTFVPEPTTPDGSIDIAALEQYGRDYAYATYGLGSNPNLSKDTNSAWFPAFSDSITSMEDGCKRVRDSVDSDYAFFTSDNESCLYGLAEDGSIARVRYNVSIIGPDSLGYSIYGFYGGGNPDDNEHIDYWEDPRGEVHRHSWEFSHYEADSPNTDSYDYVYQCETCGEEDIWKNPNISPIYCTHDWILHSIKDDPYTEVYRCNSKGCHKYLICNIPYEQTDPTEETEPPTEATTHTHTWEFSRYKAESIDADPYAEVYRCETCGEEEIREISYETP